MLLSEIFTQLTYGELSQVSLGGGEAGAIDESNYPQVLAHINLGLTSLYKRFPLKEGRVTFALQEGKTSYKLDTNEDVRFVQSGFDDEFLDDINKIERVMTDLGWELGLNNQADPYSCHTPSVITLRVPGPIVNQSLELPNYLRTSNVERINEIFKIYVDDMLRNKTINNDAFEVNFRKDIAFCSEFHQIIFK